MQAQEEVGGTGRLRASVLVFLSLAAVAAALTGVYLGMRAVMDIGGFCASGGPYVIRAECPSGVPLVMIGGIWGGIIAAGIYAWAVFSRGIPNFVGLLWSALFLSLGWNFLEYGLNPPFEGAGVAWGWLVCAVLFILMGGAPLIAALPATIRQFRASDLPTPPPGSVRMTSALRTTVPTRASARAAQQAAASSTATMSWGQGDVVARLERLNALHRSGAINDAEYDAAKRQVLEGGSGT